MFADGENCFDEAATNNGVQPNNTLINLATVSNGNVFVVSPTDPTDSNAVLKQMFDLLGVQSESIR